MPFVAGIGQTWTEEGTGTTDISQEGKILDQRITIIYYIEQMKG